MAIFRPTGTLHCITELTVDLVQALGIRAMILDVDNTLAAHGSQAPFDGVLEWTEQMKKAGIHLIVVSNNYEERVAPFAEKINLPFVSFACKPSPLGYLRAKKLMGVRVRECLVAGDQIFTDIIGANLCGMWSVLLDPLAPDPAWTVRFKRYLENFFRPHYKPLTVEAVRKKRSLHRHS